MAKKTVKVALVEYFDKDGRHLAYFGDEIDVPKEEADRLEKAGVFDQPDPVPYDVPPTIDATVASEFAKPLKDVQSRTAGPVVADDEVIAKLHHDVLADAPAGPTKAAGPFGFVADEPDTAGSAVAVAEDPAAEPRELSASEAAEQARPKSAATVDVWRQWAVEFQDIPEAEAAGMTKDDLKAL